MLRLKLFGSPQVEIDGKPAEIGRNKALALLVYLAVTQSTHRRDHLATLLWPGYDQSNARAYLRQALYALTAALGDEWCLANRETLGLRPNADFQTDVGEFEAQALAARAANATDSAAPAVASSAIAHLTQAASLAEDEFLAGFSLPDAPEFDEWQFFQRENLRQMLAGVLDALVSHYEKERNYAPAIEYARRRVLLDPLHEATHRTLMRLYAVSGQKPAALRQYAECVRLLDDDLGVAPDGQTTDLYEAVRQDKVAAAPAATLQPAEAYSVGASGSEEAVYAAPAHPITLSSPHNLPHRLTPFIGREEELAALDDLLSTGETRLITITAPGGMGKTRLALAVAEQQVQTNRFANGVYFVALAPLSDAGHIVPTMARAMGFALDSSGRRGRTPEEQVLDYLRQKEVLLLLDNFEHLLEGAQLISELLQAAPDVHALVTSRERLHMHGEQVFPIQGLDYGGVASTTKAAGEYPAVRLFQQSARRVAPNHVLSTEDLVHVTQICRSAEGMPLGIELAAAWVDVLSPAEIAAEIQRSLNFLEAEMHDAPRRHHSIRAVFDTTWQRLDETERGTFAALSVFRGGFTRQAVHEVAGATLHQLGSLAAKSLIHHHWQAPSGSGRYTVHELLRQYGSVKLAESPAVIRRARALHCAYYTGFLHERLEAINGSGQGQAANEIATELDNVRAAWQWAVDHTDIASIGRGAGAFFLFCQIRSRFLEGATALEEAATSLAALEPSAERDLVLAQLLNQQGWLRIRMGDFDKAAAVLEKSRALYIQHNAPPPPYTGEDPTTALSIVAQIRGDTDLAVALGEAARQAGEARGDKHNLAHAHYALTSAWLARGEYEVASRHAQQACELALAVGNRWFMAVPLNEWGKVARAMGDYVQAREHHQASHAIMADFDDPEGMAVALNHLGEIAILQMDPAEAEHLFQEALVIYRDINDRGGLATSLRGLGQVACAHADFCGAGKLFDRALAIAAETHFWPLLFSTLVDVSEMLLQRGDLLVGIEALARVQYHAASDHETRKHAGQRLAHWRQRLDAELYDKAVQRGKEGELESAVLALQAELTALAQSESCSQQGEKDEYEGTPHKTNEGGI